MLGETTNQASARMILKPLREIGPADIRALIDDEVWEGKTIEYKREIPGGKKDKENNADLLAGVSALANTSGGDLLLGVAAENGLPVEIAGLVLDDPDAEVLRLDQIIRSGLEPRLPRVDIQPVKMEGGSYVIVIRVAKSWTAPHRVLLKDNKFYARTSAGKYPLDVGELRTAFTLSETVAERIKRFRAERVDGLFWGKTPEPLESGGVLALHVVPLSSFTIPERFAVPVLREAVVKMQTIYGGGNPRTNLDGVLLYNNVLPGPRVMARYLSERSHAYTQLYREGTVEAACVIPRNEDDVLSLPSISYEQWLARFLGRCVAALKDLDVQPPIYVFLSLAKVVGCHMGVSGAVDGEYRPLDENVVTLPEVVVEDHEFDPYAVLRPAFDMVWNAFGLERSVNFDGDDNWRHER